MANSQAIATSFKAEILSGIHALGPTVVRASTTQDNFAAALYLTTATLGAATTTYSATGEVSGTNYTAGGINPITNAVSPTTSCTTAYWTPSANFTWVNVTLSTAFNAVLLYNSTQSNRAVAVYVFGSQTVTAGNFTLTMPANAAATALIQLN